MRLILVRHGESTHFTSGIIAGRTGCPGLTPRGMEQAQALAEHFSRSGELGPAPILLCSPFPRARQTGQIVAQTLGLPLQIDEGLMELDPGEADGLTKQEYEARYGKFGGRSNPTQMFAPGGETWGQFAARVKATPNRLAAQFPDQTVVGFTHAGFIVVSFLQMFNLPFDTTNRAWIDPDFASRTEWQWLPEENHWRLVRYNVTVR